MKKIITIFSILILVGWYLPVIAADHMSSSDQSAMTSGKDHMTSMTHDQKNKSAMSGKDSMEGMAHDMPDKEAMSDMKHMDDMDHGSTFEEHVITDGVRAEFQIMSLESMNMKDPDGASHHIMVKFFNESMNHQIKDVIGKIKVINPDKTEQLGDLKDYNGIYAGNFTFHTPGKYGVICLAKVNGKEHIYKFWYTKK